MADDPVVKPTFEEKVDTSLVEIKQDLVELKQETPAQLG